MCIYLILSLCIRFPIFGFVLTVFGCCFFFCFLFVYVFVARPLYSATMFSIFSFCLLSAFVSSSPCPKTHSNMLKFLQNICNTAVDIYTLFTLVICYLLIIFYVCIYICECTYIFSYIYIYMVRIISISVYALWACDCVRVRLLCPCVECLPKLFWFCFCLSFDVCFVSSFWLFAHRLIFSTFAFDLFTILV